MRFLCLYTADQLSEPSPQHMAEMGKYVEQQFKAGKLVDTGGLKRRDTDGFSVRRKGGDYSVNQTGAPRGRPQRAGRSFKRRRASRRWPTLGNSCRWPATAFPK